MFIQPIDYFLLVWFVLAAASTAYVAIDQFRHHTNNNNVKTQGSGGLMMLIEVS